MGPVVALWGQWLGRCHCRCSTALSLESPCSQERSLVRLPNRLACGGLRLVAGEGQRSVVPAGRLGVQDASALPRDVW